MRRPRRQRLRVRRGQLRPYGRYLSAIEPEQREETSELAGGCHAHARTRTHARAPAGRPASGSRRSRNKRGCIWCLFRFIWRAFTNIRVELVISLFGYFCKFVVLRCPEPRTHGARAFPEPATSQQTQHTKPRKKSLESRYKSCVLRWPLHIRHVFTFCACWLWSSSIIDNSVGGHLETNFFHQHVRLI